MYMYICIYMYIYIYIYIYICVYPYIYMCMHTHVCVCVRVRVCARLRAKFSNVSSIVSLYSILSSGLRVCEISLLLCVGLF